jgi:phenylpropionate dioxygenase-like ring-hydroxylating dioxygenase large terminal subunit
MPMLADDQQVAQRVLDHIARKTTDLAPAVWREPVEHYRSPAVLDTEIRQVMRRTPTPFCPSAALARPGDYVAREAAGTPLLAVRGKDGVVRAFRNACRHRGMPVASGSGNAPAFACRYHGWTYALDGQLRQVPDEHGFPGLDKGCHGLVPVQVQERLGLVFITQDLTQDGPPPNDPALDGLQPLLHPDWELLATRERVVDANWKVMLEGFIEGYHIRSTHRDSFYPYGFDNLNLIEPFGRHCRVTYPFRRIRKLADVPLAERNVDGLLTYVYHLFPNTLVTMLSRHTNLVVLEPMGVGRTLVISYTLADVSGGDEAARAAALRDADFVRDVGAAEDREVICAIQKGLASRANEHFTFGLFEGAITHFHRMLTAARGTADTL